MSMKNISISISENSQNPCKDYIIDDGLLQYIISIISAEYQYINFVWICSSDYNRISFFKRVNLYQKRITRAKGVTIHNTLRIINRLPDKRLKKFCKKNKFTLETEFDNGMVLSDVLSNAEINYKVDVISVIDTCNADLTKIYNLAKKFCSNLRFKQNFIYSQQFTEKETEKYLLKLKELFDYWLKDKDGIFLKPFIDHIRNIYKVAVEKECINSSCLGRTLNIDSYGRIYLCAQSQNSEYELGNFKNFSSVSEIFQSEVFTKLVENMIERRKSCMADCSHFNFCQGGCCACVNTYGMSKAYCEIVKELDEYISSTIQDIITTNTSLGDFNPVLANIVKEVISYNPAVLVTKESISK